MARHEGTPRAPRSGQIHTDIARFVRRRSEAAVSAEMLAGAANLYHAAHTRRVSAAGFALLQAKLPRNSSQIARGRIRRFESYMPSQAVQSPWLMSRFQTYRSRPSLVV